MGGQKMSKRIKGLELMKLCQSLTQNGIVSSEKIANGIVQYMDDGDAEKFMNLLDCYNLIGYEHVKTQIMQLLKQ